jgi:hypothetical protein
MEKKQYIAPQINMITLDKEISLVMQSETPPFGPDEGMIIQNSPFMTGTDLV